MAAGAVAVLLSVAYLPWHYDLLATVERRIDKDGVLYGDLQQAMEAPQVRAAFEACPDLTAGDHRPMPYARFWLDGAPGTRLDRRGRREPDGQAAADAGQGPDDAPHLPAEGLPEGRDARRLHDDLREPLVARQRRARLRARRPPS